MRRHVIPNSLNEGVESPCFQKDRDADDLSVSTLMHQMQHHVVRFAIHILFTGSVKVELRKLVALITHHEVASAPGWIVIIHPYGVRVVDDVVQRLGCILETQRRKLGFLRMANVDR